MEELRKCYKKLDELRRKLKTDTTQTSWILLILMKK